MGQMRTLPIDHLAHGLLRRIGSRLVAHEIYCKTNRRQRVSQLMCKHPEKLVNVLGGLFHVAQMAAFRQVLRDLGESNQTLFDVIQRSYYHPRPEMFAVFSHAPAFVLCPAGSAREGKFLPGLACFQVPGGIKAGEMLAENLIATIALDAFGARVPAGNKAL